MLDHVSTEDLMDELIQRTDHACIILLKELNNSKYQVLREWTGNHHMAMGLCSDMIDCLINELHNMSEDIDGIK